MKSSPTTTRSSFFLPMWFMSAERRRALHILYDFCRCVDDAVDEVVNADEAAANLAYWQRELDAIYHGSPSHLVARKLQETVREYGIEESVLKEMMLGFATDCVQNVLLQDDAALEQYCTRVAGCVGIASLPIFGVSVQTYTPFAIALGHALQLTNILRDLDDDLARGRCYISKSQLSRYGIQANDTQIQHAQAWNAIASDMAIRALEFFEQTEKLVLPNDRRKLIPALLMRDAYRLLLERMMKSGMYFHKTQKIKRHTSDVVKLLMHAIRYSV